MTYTEFAKLKFQEILDGSPANECSLYPHENGVTIDCGVEANGGWMAGRALLEGLTGGRGQVNYSERMVDGMQLPTVDLYLDDPVESAKNFISDDSGIMGVKTENGYALGVTVTDHLCPYPPGNIVALRCGCLMDCILDAARAIPTAVVSLQNAGINDIQWAWSSCPIAAMTDDDAEMTRRKAAMSANHAVISIWVRGEDEIIQTTVENFPFGQLRVHNLTSAKTFVKE